MELKTRTENTLATLIERGKRSGSLTYDQVNAARSAYRCRHDKHRRDRHQSRVSESRQGFVRFEYSGDAQ